MSITIHDIAKLAGVSIGTVDRVIHNRKGVSVRTSELVNDLIEKHNFKPNIVAQAMQKFNNKINLVVLTFRYTVMYYPGIYRGFLEAAAYLQQFGYKCRVKIIENRTVSDMCEALENLIGENVNACFTVLGDNEEYRNIVKKLDDNNIKIVSLNKKVEGAFYHDSLPAPTHTGQLTAETMNLLHGDNDNILYIFDKQDFFGIDFKNLIVDGYKSNIRQGINTIYIDATDEFDVYNLTKKHIGESNIRGIIVMAPFSLKAVLKAQEDCNVKIKTYTNDNSSYARECLKEKKLSLAFLYDVISFTKATIINSFRTMYPEIPFDFENSNFQSQIYLPINMEESVK